MKDTLTLKPNVVVEARDAITGEVIYHEEVHNLVVDTGMAHILSMLNGGSTLSAAISQVAVGTGDTAPDPKDTELLSEVNRGWVSLREAGSGSITVQRYIGTETANGYDLAEAGLFCGTVLGYGLMFARATFTPFTKTSAASVTITWTIGLGVPA